MILTLLALDLVGFAVLVHGLVTAVEGYQDELGFHEGLDSRAMVVAFSADLPIEAEGGPAARRSKGYRGSGRPGRGRRARSGAGASR
jgi:hypothetical protein